MPSLLGYNFKKHFEYLRLSEPAVQESTSIFLPQNLTYYFVVEQIKRVFGNN